MARKLNTLPYNDGNITTCLHTVTEADHALVRPTMGVDNKSKVNPFKYSSQVLTDSQSVIIQKCVHKLPVIGL